MAGQAGGVRAEMVIMGLPDWQKQSGGCSAWKRGAIAGMPIAAH